MTAAHGGYDSEAVPLGGGAAICERLCQAWGTRVELTLLGPGPVAPPGVRYERLNLLGDRIPSQLSELQYARFCREFERECTRRILAEPAPVLTHDISEGPDFAALGRAGVRCGAILHVDVVDFFNRFYLGGLLPAHWLTRAWRRLAPYLPIPDVLKLVFQKQQDAVDHCAFLVAPSQPMRSILERCYPGLASNRIEVIGWGSPLAPPDPSQVGIARELLRERWGLAQGRPLLLTLSRISPEKGHDLLLEALALGERRGEAPAGLTLAIAGRPAYMRGQLYLRKLEKMASRLGCRVVFCGHVGGADKRALYELADLFVVPSRHESYGLTTMEAMAAGCPVVAVRSYGTETTVTPASGRLVERSPAELWQALRELLADRARRDSLSEGARARAATETFELAQNRLLERLAQ